MNTDLVSSYTQQFYEWEHRGRGWDVYEHPVFLEPRYYPLLFKEQYETFEDDGATSSWWDSIISLFTSSKEKHITEKIEEDEVTDAFVFSDDVPLVCLSVRFPKGHKVGVTEMEQFIVMLSYCSYPISFELIASASNINMQFVCRTVDQHIVQHQLKAYFPLSSCIVSVDTLDTFFKGESYYATANLGLAEEFMRPLAQVRGFDLDPYVGLFGMFDQLQDDEQCVLQILFSGAVNSWSKSIVQSVTSSDGSSFFIDAPEMVKLAQEKVAHPLFGVTLSLCVKSMSDTRADSLCNALCFAINHLSKSESNSLVQLSNASYLLSTRIEDIYARRTHRLGMLLNSRELITLLHFPSVSVTTSKLNRSMVRSKQIASSQTRYTHVLGVNNHLGVSRNITVSTEQRMQHTHVVGATGTGKSTFLLESIRQDIANGHGLALFDPHGDIAEQVIASIPKSRLDDVIIVDPSDVEFPVGLNILSAHSDIEKEVLASDLVAIFKRLSTSWGDQMNSVFANAILAMLESSEKCTLFDLRRFLIEKSFRDTFLSSIKDPHIVYYWQKEFPLLKSSSIAPILTRLDTFLRPKPIRNIVTQKEGLDFASILNTNKIFIVKLSQGIIGAENSYLLGSLLLSKLQQTALGRQSIEKEHRKPFYIYIDEFQHFISPSLSSMLSGARKYNVGLILAHQDIQQIQHADSELTNALITNAGIRVCFRLGETDAKKLESGYLYFNSEDFLNLGRGEAIVRIEKSDNDFNMQCVVSHEKLETVSFEDVLKNSREKYATTNPTSDHFLEEITSVEPATQSEVSKPKVSEKVIEDVKEEEKVIQPNISEHRYLQTLIKRMAESFGYTATIEQSIPDGTGRVDVSLERNNFRIACEISITTSHTWEIHNIKKCFGAGYDIVAVCSRDTKTLSNIRKIVSTELSESEQRSVLVLFPDELIKYLEDNSKEKINTETRSKGYRVKVSYEQMSSKEMESKKDSIGRVIADSIRKMRNK